MEAYVMNFNHYDLGNLDKGRTVEIVLEGNAANVYLLDNVNYKQYVRGVEFQAVGGLKRSSPVKLQTTKLAHWHVVIDLPSGHGIVKTSYRVLPQKALLGADDKLATFTPTDAQKRARPGSAGGGLSDAAPQQTPAAILTTAPASQLATAVRTTTTIAAGADRTACRFCGSRLGLGKFCADCGEPVEKICKQCGTLDRVNGKFCVECGTKLFS